MRLKTLTGNKWFKRLGLPLLVLLVLILISSLIINLYFSPVLSTQLKKTVFRLSNGLYKVDFAESSLDILTGRIVIDHLTLKPDNAVFTQLKTAGKAPNNIYTLAVDRIVLKRIHPFKLYFKKELDVDEIVISQPSVLAQYKELHNHDLPDSGKKSFYKHIAGTLKSLRIGQVLLNNINLNSREEINNQVKVRHLKEIDLKITDLLIDSTSENDKSRFNFCKDITAVFNNYGGQTDNKLYQYKAKTLTFSSAKSNIKLANAVFMPLKTANSLANRLILQRRFQIQADSIVIDHFDYKKFFSYRDFIASAVTVYGKRVDVFYDRTLSKKPVDSAKKGLYGLLKSVRRNIAIKTIKLRGIDVFYTEVSAKTKLQGAIAFEQLNGSVNNIVTGDDTAQTNRKITASLTANLMGYGKLDLNVVFNPADPAHIIYYKGTLGAMNLVNLNPATKPLGLIQFTNGIVTNLSFNMEANAEKATGTVVFLYHDLNVLLLRQDEKNALKRMPFVSVLANAFVLIRNNPTFNSPPRIENVVYERPENTSYSGFLWRSVYSGIKGSIGLSAEIEHNLRQRVSDYKQNKEQRELNKANRQERRKVRRLKRQLKEAQGY